ncbi:hypothetical protein FALBO_2853 [Fusarium albosuccineum]|uniref:Uncharacterized protein n=1 Tax=Fusarium albosuccineum TaxID=1237068 RepID=A0A8H4LMQ6_9HYPO|nr:hypothetical protein FALBO_2853 [Fusarium albosuccineum]
MCLCGTIRQLEADFDPDKATELASELNKHLAAIRSILAKSKSLSREVRYQVIPNNQRTMKISSLKSVDIEGTNSIYDRFKDDANGFWNFDNNGYRELRRRLACVVVYLRSKLDAQSWVPPNLSSIVQGQKPSELRYAGNKYIKMARKLGDPSLTLSHHNLLLGYGDCFPSSDQVLLLLVALGGSAVPIELLKNIRLPQRRWTDDGEIQSTSAIDFGLPTGLITILSDDECLKQVAECPEITQNTLDDGALTWSLKPKLLASFSGRLSAQTEEDWATIGLKLLCFTCPPCYEGKVNWPPQTKKAIWALLDKATDRKRIPVSLKPQIIDALLFFSERDFFAIRCVAVERARSFLRKSMSYYYHASVTLFESIMLRLDGHLDKSDAKIKDFMEEYNDTGTRCDNALLGRLHISNIENKIHRYDTDVASCMYQWEGIHPLSTFEIEVTRRLQGTAARFFHSVGDFQTAQASLEQHLWLNSTKPIRPNTRLLIVTRLAEIHCELHDFEKALQVLQPELDGIPQKKGRPFRRLSMVMVEAYIGLGSLDPAESILQQLLDVEPPELDDINDQMLHMRRLILVARVAHERLYFDQALHLWQLTLQMMEQLSIFKARHPWIAAIIYLSMAHLQLTLGDAQGGRLSWDAAVEISMRERYEYVIPILATGWLRKVVGAIHQEQGWPFRVMLPGGKPDMTWQ